MKESNMEVGGDEVKVGRCAFLGVNAPFDGRDFWHFKDVCAHVGAQEQWPRLASDLSLQKLHAWDLTTHHNLPSREFTIRSPCEVTFYRAPPPPAPNCLLYFGLQCCGLYLHF